MSFIIRERFEEFQKERLSRFIVRSPEEQRLHDLMSEYSSEYFEDFRFEPGSVVSDFLPVEDFYEARDPLVYFNQAVLDVFNYKVEPLKDCGGYVDPRDFTIAIDPEHMTKRVLLHELIHIYEFALDLVPKFYHDVILICLYNALKDKVMDLDDKIRNHANIYSCDLVAAKGGDYDILFFLKSLDLDIRLGYKLGTVCSYGQDR